MGATQVLCMYSVDAMFRPKPGSIHEFSFMGAVLAVKLEMKDVAEFLMAGAGEIDAMP
ncbi:hypothetical protein SH668x_002074 [Planctomicrobium sp. SH668]|uniref:hypothetical protein n=1 Tax=Planctomicrobium sp. SH668 TaxID=3448126 RepID=UPI003F5BD2B5